MKVIEQSAELMFITPNALAFIEKIGRVCYKSENLITPESNKIFIKKLLDPTRKHESVLEHANATFRFITDRGVTHEIVRHRIASYSQECISGDTEIHKGITIKQLYDRKDIPHGKTHNKTIWLKSVNNDNEVIPNKINEIFYKGKQEVYELSTRTGYKIQCTLNHEFLTNHGFKKLQDLKINDNIYVNGRKSLVKMPAEEIKKMYLEDKLNISEISELCGIKNTRSVLRILHILNIFKSHLNDKNKEKYQKNYTNASIEKTATTVRNQYKNGRLTWNKGLLEKDCASVKKQGDVLRKNHYNKSGKSNSNWKNGISTYKSLKKNIEKCECCNNKNINSAGRLEVHHIDKNRKNNIFDNLLKVCTKCHKLFHKKWYKGTITVLDKIVNITHVGIKDTYDLEMKSPYHNYIANGFVVHNSTRYCNYQKGKFGSELTMILPVWFKEIPIDKGGNIVEHNKSLIDATLVNRYMNWHKSCEEDELRYKLALELGDSAQEARDVLPNSLKTEIVMTANFREWRHFFKSRTAQTAHPQMRELAESALGIIKKHVDIIFEEL